MVSWIFPTCLNSRWVEPGLFFFILVDGKPASLKKISCNHWGDEKNVGTTWNRHYRNIWNPSNIANNRWTKPIKPIISSKLQMVLFLILLCIPYICIRTPAKKNNNKHPIVVHVYFLLNKFTKMPMCISARCTSSTCAGCKGGKVPDVTVWGGSEATSRTTFPWVMMFNPPVGGL